MRKRQHPPCASPAGYGSCSSTAGPLSLPVPRVPAPVFRERAARFRAFLCEVPAMPMHRSRHVVPQTLQPRLAGESPYYVRSTPVPVRCVPLQFCKLPPRAPSDTSSPKFRTTCLKHLLMQPRACSRELMAKAQANPRCVAFRSRPRAAIDQFR